MANRIDLGARRRLVRVGTDDWVELVAPDRCETVTIFADNTIAVVVQSAAPATGTAIAQAAVAALVTIHESITFNVPHGQGVYARAFNGNRNVVVGENALSVAYSVPPLSVSAVTATAATVTVGSYEDTAIWRVSAYLPPVLRYEYRYAQGADAATEPTETDLSGNYASSLSADIAISGLTANRHTLIEVRTVNAAGVSESAYIRTRTASS